MAIELVDALSGLANIDVTSGASPVTITLADASARQVTISVTTGGTGGEEVINLPRPVRDIYGYINKDYINNRYSFVLVAQTDSDDVVKFQNDDSDGVTTLASTGAYLPTPNSFAASVKASYLGANVTFVWIGDRWVLDYSLADQNIDVVWQPNSISISTVDGTAAAPPQSISIIPGAAEGSTNDDGAALTISTGAGAGSGRGGDLIVGAAFGGFFKLGGLPTADPHVSEALWNSAGTLKISAG